MLNDNRGRQLAQKLSRWVREPGLLHSNVENVKIIYADTHHPRTPVMYEPCVIIVLQGQKTGYLGERVFQYGPSHYLLMTLPLPCECETFASPQEPLVGLSVQINTTMLQNLLMDMGDVLRIDEHGGSSGVQAVPLEALMLNATERLVSLMESPLQARVLGPQVVREMLFYALCSEGGGALLALANRNSHFSQIAKALRLIEQQYAMSLNVNLLAQEVNMSISAFHHNFKAVTATSPLQYIKSYRLHKARIMMLYDGLKASTAAVRVGYESASQFSREYKRFFGSTPSEQRTRYEDGKFSIIER